MNRSAVLLTFALATPALVMAGTAPVPLAVDASCDDDVTAADFPALVRLLGDDAIAPCGRGDVDGSGSVDAVDLRVSTRTLFAVVDVRFDFTDGEQGWMAGFADYDLVHFDSLELEEGLRPLPAELGLKGGGFYLQGKNVSDDLFMYLTRHLGAEDGVPGNQAYDVVHDLRFASNAPSGCIGVGGAPGESVYLKAGASPIGPMAVGLNGFVSLNVDKGVQSNDGPVASVSGNIANGLPCEDLNDPPYVSLRQRHVHATTVPATAAGDLWLLIGTDSAYEGVTGIYYQTIQTLLVPAALEGRCVNFPEPQPACGPFEDYLCARDGDACVCGCCNFAGVGSCCDYDDGAPSCFELVNGSDAARCISTFRGRIFPGCPVPARCNRDTARCERVLRNG